MNIIAVSQRVDIIRQPNGAVERRDALDQAWPTFLAAAGCLCVPVPNNLELAQAILRELPIDGLLLTGGNDLVAYGGDAPERDAVQSDMLRLARDWKMPVLGVCGGMQAIQEAFGVPLERVEGHVADAQTIEIEGAPVIVNSFHHWGARASSDALDVWARAPDGVVKAIRHRAEPIMGVMWHPERIQPFARADLSRFRVFFSERLGDED